MSCIALIGLMGSGKSTIGALLAERTGARFVDVDQVIEARTGRSVRELWEEGGEVAYRRLESESCLEAIATGSPEHGEAIVLATPGGAVLDPEVQGALRACTVIWLRADPSVLGERVSVGDHRPLIGTDPTAVLAAMSTDRATVYGRLADLTVDVDHRTAGEVAGVILDALDSTSDADTADQADPTDPATPTSPTT